MTTNRTPEQPEEFQPQALEPQTPQPQGRQSSGGLFGIPTKWLLIGGGGGGALLIVIVVALLLVIGGGGGGASGGGNILGYIPANAAFVVIKDVETQANSEGLEDFVEFMNDRGDDSRDTRDIGMDDDNIELFATVYESFGGDDILWIVKGDLEFDEIREELDDELDCEDDEYRGFEMWQCADRSFPAAVAIFEKDRYVVIASQDESDLEQLLTHMSRDPEELANDEDSDIGRILDTAGDGWIQIVSADDCPVNRCQGFGLALWGEESDSLDVSFALMFGSERTAEAMESDIEIDDFLTNLLSALALELDIGNVKADGEFVTGDGIAEFVDPDDSRSSNQNSGDQSRDGAGSARPAAAEATAMPRPAATQAPLATKGAPTSTPIPTPTPVPIREPESIFNLIPESSQQMLLVRWDQTQSGGFLPNTLERQVFNVIDSVKNTYDISPDNISEIAFVENANLTVLHGDFDLGTVRNRLEDQGGESITYRGYEMWRYNRGEMILFEQYIAFGSGLENILQSLYRGSGSLADASENNELKHLLGTLGDGIILRADRNCSQFENCLGYGWSIAEIDESADTGKMEIEFLFRNERSARRAADDYNPIANFLRQQRINIHDTVADGNSVKGEATWEFSQ